MRYYDFVMLMKAEDIKSDKVRLKDYSYENNVDALATYMFKNLPNGISFVIYRKEDECLKSMFAADEKTWKSDTAFAEVLNALEYVLGFKVKTTTPAEITMIDFDANLQEAKRRGLIQYWTKIVDQAGILIYDEREAIATGRCGFKLDEKVARKGASADADCLCDKTLKDERARIAKTASSKSSKSKTKSDAGAFPADYIIAAKSSEAGSVITLNLMEALADAGRLPSGRMELITDIEWDLYRHGGLFERVIENSHGGTIVIDMTGRFGSDPTNYTVTCNYIANLVNKHRNDNLFVFLYDMDNPGFTYTLIPLIEKTMFLIEVREGKGDRAAAEEYLKQLIGRTELKKYASQAGEFLDAIDEELGCAGTYSQTDILRAHESFDSWCIRKNLMKEYAIDGVKGFCIARDTDGMSAYEQLQKMIGLAVVKEQIDNIILAGKAERQRKKRGGKGRSMHMTFEGNPGTGKTEVAEIFARIMKEAGVLKSGAFVVKPGVEMNGFFASAIVKHAFEQAEGGVLFIDEAYGIQSDATVTALIREMEAHRNDVIVIFAGYKERMHDFIDMNEGLKSRIPYSVQFPDYSPEELVEIYDYLLGQSGYTATEGAREAAREIFVKAARLENFGNGRYARNLAEKSTLNLSVKLARKYGDAIPESKLYKVTKEDVFIPNDPIVNGNDGETKRAKSGDGKTAREQLDEMIGLAEAKKVIESAIATFVMQKNLRKRGVDIGRNSMSMVFTGNPGVAKTTVARLLAEILKDEGVLSSGVFVEAGRADLVGQYVGQTAPKVVKKFKEAMGGVLFIDEAYSLNDGYDRGSFGDEAINTIVQEMENRKDDMVVIFAGYPDEMNNFVARNPGMSSRVAYRVHFDDYSVDELCDITRYMASQRNLRITDEAIEKLVPIYEAAATNKTFGNGRYVRKVIEQAIANLALRLYKIDQSKLSDEVLTTIEAEDITMPVLDPDSHRHSRKIGFVA